MATPKRRHDYPDQLGPFLFTFAIVADSHVEAEESEMLAATGSVRGSNSRTNNRNRQIVRLLSELAPAFVVHLGDHVDTVPAQSSYATAAISMKGVFHRLQVPLHLTPGNVDVGDKPASWMPAAPVTAESLAAYRAAFGPDRYAFTHAGCRCIVINSSLFNTGLDEEGEQRRWLERELAVDPARRRFMFTHYPFFLTEPCEDGHYDNIDEPARSWILSLVEAASVEAVFAGHVHNFFYNRYGSAELYVLPSTAFVRRDYSEMFRIGPADEAGRNDAEKVGFFLVDVHERGHVAHFIRSRGVTSELDLEAFRSLLPGRPAHPKLRRPRAAGVDLRHAWCETTSLPYTSPVDEFVRKRARNDYGIQALWDLGIRDLRVPLRDLDDVATRNRMRDLVAVGHRFTVFSAGAPGPETRSTLQKHAALVDAWEAVVPLAQLETALPPIEQIARDAAIPLYLSKLWSSAEEHRAARRFRYHVTGGFAAADRDQIAACLARRNGRAPIGGLGFRIGFDQDFLAEMSGIDAVADQHDLTVMISVSLAPSHPSDANRDEVAIAHRVALAVMIGHFRHRTRVFLDTFAEIDRGYFVRSGLVDRRYNLAEAGRVWRNLAAVLDDLGTDTRLSIAGDGADRVLAVEQAAGPLLVLLGPGAATHRLTTVLPGIGDRGQGTLIDLRSGDGSAIGWKTAWVGGRRQFAIEPAIRSPWPALLMLNHR